MTCNLLPQEGSEQGITWIVQHRRLFPCLSASHYFCLSLYITFWCGLLHIFLSSPEHFVTPADTIVAPPDRRVVVVELVKDPIYGIGMIIVGGENMGHLDLGIFVKSLEPNGPAAHCGKIRPGDRIVAINGQSLEGVPHYIAVEMIRESSTLVQLVLTQTISPFRLGLVEDTDSLTSMDAATVEGLIAKGKGLTSAPNDRQTLSGRSTPGQLSRTIEGQDDVDNPVAGPSMMRTDSPADSSDLDLENVLPPEALSTDYIQGHMTKPASRESSGAGSQNPPGKQGPKIGRTTNHVGYVHHNASLITTLNHHWILCSITGTQSAAPKL